MLDDSYKANHNTLRNGDAEKKTEKRVESTTINPSRPIHGVDTANSRINYFHQD